MNSMRAEIISIGDEIASGQILDTNSQWLSQRLEELGIHVLYHSTVGDDLDADVQVVQQAIQRADVVLMTGGLGPTADDLTREALAKATGRDLVLDPEALEYIRQMFARRKRQMPKQNEVQALFPAGSRMIPNPNGTAPGIALEVPRHGAEPCRLFALPGVPAEMKEMWYQSVADALRKAGAGRRIIRHRLIKCFGAGESRIEAMLPNLIHRATAPTVGITASQTTIILRITAEGVTEEQCDAIMEPTISTIRQRLGSLVFGQDDEELQDVVVRLLRQQGKTLATAEWGTGGLVANWLADVAEAEGFYLGGIVAPGGAALQRALELAGDLAARHSAASGQVAQAMAAGCKSRFQADYGLAVSGFPKFDPAAEPKPAFFALATPEAVAVKSVPFAGHPATLKIYCAKHALNMLRLALMGD